MNANDFAMTHWMPTPRSADTAFSRELPHPKAVPATTMFSPALARFRKSGFVCFRQYSPYSSLVLHTVSDSAGASYVR